MSCYEVVDNLFSKIRKKDKLLISKVQIHWGETEKLDKKNIPIEHVIKIYQLVINHIAVMDFFYQSEIKEIAKLKIKEKK